MKLHVTYLAGLLILSYTTLFAQSSPAAMADIDRWKKAVVKLESIQQRYNFDQVESILHKMTDTIRGLSQHDKYNTQGELLTIKDTIRGTAVLIADGGRIYLVTAKHLIKATENITGNIESINDLISIKTNVNNLPSHDISLMNLYSTEPKKRPFVFSSDENDLGIISLQKEEHRAILAYLKQQGCQPLPLAVIDDQLSPADPVVTFGFPALSGREQDTPVLATGKIVALGKAAPTFTCNLSVYPGNCGGPVFKNNKLIGILSYQNGILNNIDAAKHPYQKADAAMAIKAPVILPLLKQLQEQEAKWLVIKP